MLSRRLPFLWAVAPALLWCWLFYHLHYEWSLNPQYTYGWGVPFLAGFLFYLRWSSRPAPERSVDAVIDHQLVRTVFQPVVHLATGSIAGFEALSRGPAGSTLESPLALFDAARAAGRLGELDWLCRSRAMLASFT